VFYEVFVRSFADSNGDGIGDLRGLTERLDYLNDGDPATTDDLGITGIWLMPVAEATSYHGYDVTDYRAIEADYGTTEDFRDFMAAARERGIAVIVDLVLNHTSVDHPWFQASRDPGSPYADWYRWEDAHPGYAGPDGRPAWHADGDRFYYGQFWSGMPDLDLTNPEVTAELEDVARYWLEDLGVDGFRLDAIKHLVEEGQAQIDTPATIAWLEAFRETVRSIRPDALVVGEVYGPTLAAARYVPAAVDITFDFELAGKILQGATIGEAPSLTGHQQDVLRRYAGGDYAAFLTNHDQVRAMSRLNDLAAARAAASVLLTNPGVPFLYYGEEIGMEGGKPDERIRTPLPWTATPPGFGFTDGEPWEPLQPGWETANLAAQADDGASLLSHYRSLIRTRDALPALRAGTLMPLASTAATVYAFLASRDGETVAVIVNLGTDDVSDYELALESDAACGLTRASVAYADGLGSVAAVRPPMVGTDGTIAGWRPVEVLPARSTLVLTLDR
jgi:alpha-amylase